MSTTQFSRVLLQVPLVIDWLRRPGAFARPGAAAGRRTPVHPHYAGPQGQPHSVDETGRGGPQLAVALAGHAEAAPGQPSWNWSGIAWKTVSKQNLFETGGPRQRHPRHPGYTATVAPFGLRVHSLPSRGHRADRAHCPL